METLPIEILRYYIDDIYDCVAVRRTCKHYRGFTVNLPLLWSNWWCSHVMDENCNTGVASMVLICGARTMSASIFTNNRSGMGQYLNLSALVGAEFTMWLCSSKRDLINPEIAKITAAGYTHRVAIGARTAVYIKTAELLERMYIPGADYFDVFW